MLVTKWDKDCVNQENENLNIEKLNERINHVWFLNFTQVKVKGKRLCGCKRSVGKKTCLFISLLYFLCCKVVFLLTTTTSVITTDSI